MRKALTEHLVVLRIKLFSSNGRWGFGELCLLVAVISAYFITSLPSVRGVSTGIVISQVYAGGGESGATIKNDFIELFNRGTTTIDVTGWSVQYASPSGLDWQKTELSGAIAPGQFYLVQQAAGVDGSTPLPLADAVGNIPMSASGGRVALVSDNTPLTSTVNCPADGRIVDVVGYGISAVCFEGSAPAVAPSNATAVLRGGEGCTDTDSNSYDFVIGTPNPRNTTMPLIPCAGASVSKAELALVQTGPASVDAGGRVSYQITVTNRGPAAASRVIITDTLPAGLTGVAANNGGVVRNGTIVWPTVASLAAGASLNFTVSGNAPTVARVLLATARCASDTFDPEPTNNQARVTTVVQAGAQFNQTGLTVEITGPIPCTGPGSVLNVEAKLTNNGFTAQANNTGHEFEAQLPPQLSAFGCSASAGKCTVPKGRKFVQWDGTVNVGQTVTILFQVQVAFNTRPNDPFCVVSTVNFDSDNDGVNDASTSVSSCAELSCGPAIMPGDPPPDSSEASDDKPGAVLVYPLYSSSASALEKENTRINITNTSSDQRAIVHLFFVDGASCSVADAYLCMTPEQTVSLLASDLDPGVTGYLIAVVVDEVTGCPLYFNALIGDEYVKLESGHAANLGAMAFTALTDPPAVCDELAVTTTINFDGVQYNQAPRVLSAGGLFGPADNGSTILVLNSLSGDLSQSVDPLGKVFGVLFDDLENGYSFSFSAGCQFRSLLSNSFPRTTPRLTQIIPAGRSGWMKMWMTGEGGMIGSVLYTAPNSKTDPTVFVGGRNLHTLKLAPTSQFIIPIIVPFCSS